MSELTPAEKRICQLLTTEGLKSKRVDWGGGWVTYEELRKAAKKLGPAYYELLPDLMSSNYRDSPLWSLLHKGYVEDIDYPTRLHGSLSVYRVASPPKPPKPDYSNVYYR